MRISPRLIASFIATVWWRSLSVHGAMAQNHPTVSELVQELRSEKTTNMAREQILKFRKSDPTVRKSLAASLPLLIKMGPDSCRPSTSLNETRWHSCPWYNSVELAGEFKIGEAVPALGPWFSWSKYDGVIVGLSSELSLEPYVAARALAKIGDPAIRTVQSFLESSQPQEHYRAVRVLCMINTPKAQAVLRDDLPHELDPLTQQMIKETLGEQ